MTEQDYLELLDFIRRWESRHPIDKTPFGYKVIEQSKQRIKEYENNHLARQGKWKHVSIQSARLKAQ